MMTSLEDLTYMATCNGLARRILKDLDGHSTKDLKKAYKNDRDHAGENYKEIIELGELLKSLKE